MRLNLEQTRRGARSERENTSNEDNDQSNLDCSDYRLEFASEVKIEPVEQAEDDDRRGGHLRHRPVGYDRFGVGMDEQRVRSDRGEKAHNEGNDSGHETQRGMKQPAQVVVFASGVRKVCADFAITKSAAEC